MTRLSLFLLAFGLFGAAHGAGTPADPGFDVWGKYERIEPPQPTADPTKVEVVEAFSYACIHCYRFLPLMEKWLAGRAGQVDYRRLPAVFRDDWLPLAHAYYTAEVLGVTEKIHAPLFEAIHVKKRKLFSREAVRGFFLEHGVSAEKFDSTYNSFGVASQVRRAQALAPRYGVRSTPTVLINGKYRTNGKLAGGRQELIKVVERLVDIESETTQ